MRATPIASAHAGHLRYSAPPRPIKVSPSRLNAFLLPPPMPHLPSSPQLNPSSRAGRKIAEPLVAVLAAPASSSRPRPRHGVPSTAKRFSPQEISSSTHRSAAYHPLLWLQPKGAATTATPSPITPLPIPLQGSILGPPSTNPTTHSLSFSPQVVADEDYPVPP